MTQRATRSQIERRSHELAATMKQRREGLHVEQAADLMDNLQLAASRDFEVEQLSRETEELALVQRALDTLDAGSYGMCIDCEQQIPDKRLKAMPWAVRCVPCQQAFEVSDDSTHDSASAWLLQATSSLAN